MTATPSCACEVVVHPRIVDNPPGRDAVDYRVGDYAAFRRALLVPRAGEHALAGWHPEAGTDLALQLLEWWAYLADVLAFYNERAIQEVLLRTAALPEDIRRIVRLVGYRPRPGIGATGVVAALTDAVDPFLLPRGFAIEGQSASGEPAQVFELDDDIEIGRIGGLLPRSARFPSLRLSETTGTPDGSGASGSSGPALPPGSSSIGSARPRYVPRDGAGRLRNTVNVSDAPADGPPPRANTLFSVFLDGVVAAAKPEDILLVVKRNWRGHLLEPLGYAVTTVRAIKPLFDTAAPPVTELQMLAAHDLPAPLAQCRLLRPTKLSHLWLYHERYPGSTNPALIGAGMVAQVVQTIFDPLGLFHGGGLPTRPPEDPRVITGLTTMGMPPPHGVAHLEALARGITAGDLVLFEKRAGGGIFSMFQQLITGSLPSAALAPLRLLLMQLVKVAGYAEDIWYANAPEMDRVGMGPPVGPPGHGIISGGEGAIPIPHSRLTFDINPFLDAMALGDHDLNTIVVHHGWEELAELAPPPPARRPAPKNVAVAALPEVPATAAVPVVIQDRNGRGDYGWLGQTTDLTGTTGAAGTAGTGGVTTGTTTTVQLVPPLQALLNVLPISRGQTVTGEVIGSGDPVQARQELTLKQAPLTYLADTGPRSTNGYRSTLRIRVDGIEWREVPSFFDQPADARVFVTREDDEQRTHVRFGDGEHGARLPAGTDNVVADYRHGSGAATPLPGTLTSIVRPRTGLAGIVDAIPVGGGADPDPPDQLRRYAPRSVLAFGRAISGDDYETVAAQTPGVRRSRVYWSWDARSQRTAVKVFVGDDPAAVSAARDALAAFGDPNRPVIVGLATPVIVDLTLRLQVDPAYSAGTVMAQVAAALLDPQQRPFGADVIRIGEAIYDSQIHAACRNVPGVVAVHGLRFGTWSQLPDGGGDSSGPPPPPPAITDLFNTWLGKDTIADDFYDPLALAVAYKTDEATVYDPFALAKHLATQAVAGGTPLVPVVDELGPREVVQLESGARHSPGEGNFYLLREERLHLSAEIARHVL